MCTTEIGRLALKYKDLQAKGVLLATLSCDAVESHTAWLQDVVAHCEAFCCPSANHPHRHYAHHTRRAYTPLSACILFGDSKHIPERTT